MTEPSRATMIEREVAWGESAELGILKRWLGESLYAATAARIVKSEGFDRFDYLLLDKFGLPVCYVEVKRRRPPLSKYGDALFPHDKHLFARRCAAFNIPCIGVVEYGCGALVEVDLAKRPSRTDVISRRDRPWDEGSKHAIYSKRQLTVLAEGLE